jgi:hypothetical protein
MNKNLDIACDRGGKAFKSVKMLQHFYMEYTGRSHELWAFDLGYRAAEAEHVEKEKK